MLGSGRIVRVTVLGVRVQVLPWYLLLVGQKLNGTSAHREPEVRTREYRNLAAIVFMSRLLRSTPIPMRVAVDALKQHSCALIQSSQTVPS
jgi:hypothetical protein